MIGLLIVMGLGIWASFVVILVVGFGMTISQAAAGSLAIAIVVLLIDAWERRGR